jgi:hypothetical protein
MLSKEVNMSKVQERSKSSSEEVQESPKVYVSKSGVHYIKPEEFFKSTKGKELIKVAAKLKVKVKK